VGTYTSEVEGTLKCQGLPSHGPNPRCALAASAGTEDLHIRRCPRGGRDTVESGCAGKWPTTLAEYQHWQKLTDGSQWTAEQMCKRHVTWSHDAPAPCASGLIR